MKTKLITIISIIAIVCVLTAVFVLGRPNFTASTNPTGKIFSLPKHAVEVAPGVFYLGQARDIDGRVVEGYAFVDYKKGYGKPSGCNNDGVCQGWEDPSCADCAGGEPPTTDTSSCYGFLSKGAKWKTVEPYLVDPTNNAELNGDFIKNNLATDICKWESAAGGVEILGIEGTEPVDRNNIGNLNGKNEVIFADVNYPGAIAVTIIWGYFSGPPPFRELVEWDQVYDDVDFGWSSSGEAGKMDFENIATHELGHSVGLDDLYDSKCSEMTMYGYVNNGEIKKRTLEDGDIAGIQKLYS